MLKEQKITKAHMHRRTSLVSSKPKHSADSLTELLQHIFAIIDYSSKLMRLQMYLQSF